MTASALESRIDDLYRARLSDFIPARTTLAKSLAGDEAKRVRALAKPTVVPWAVNQVYWHARPVWDRLMKSGEQLRAAQVTALEGRKADVRAAADDHRKAIADAVRQAETIAREAGAQPAADALSRTFEALSLRPESGEAPGRLTKPLQPAGFEALTGVQVSPRTVAAGSDAHAPAKSAAARRKEEAARKKEEAARKKHEAEVRRAEAALERAKKKMAEAKAALEQTRAGR